MVGFWLCGWRYGSGEDDFFDYCLVLFEFWGGVVFLWWRLVFGRWDFVFCLTLVKIDGDMIKWTVI